MPPVTAAADRTQVVQLLQNLVANALTFVAPGTPPRVRVSARTVGGTVRVEVADNGLGVPPDQRERVFHAFARLHPQEEYPGSGIGLATCQRIVRRHGGQIWIEDGPGGQGTTVVLTLPAAPDHPG